MRIALIAMSGIRACDEELLRVGLTLPGFVERSQTIASLPSLGLLTLAGMTPPQHECCYIEMGDIRWKPFAVVDAIMGVAFAWAYFALRSIAWQPSGASAA